MAKPEGENKPIEKAEIDYAAGKMMLSVGRQFTMFDGDKYVIEAFINDRIYSSAGEGGTPIIKCRYVGGKPMSVQYESEAREGYIDFCADSVALAISQEQVIKIREN